MHERVLKKTAEARVIEDRVQVLSTNLAYERAWVEMLGSLFEEIGFAPESFECSHSASSGEAGLIFIDSRRKDLAQAVRDLPRDNRSLFLILDETDGGQGIADEVFACVDDVIVYPFRRFEVESKIRLHRLLRAWSDVHHMNVSFQGLLENLTDDLALTERLQKGQLPVRFPAIRGFRIRSRYLAGLRSGGDHFDVAESRDGSRVSLVLSDSSSYGLSSAFLNSLMRVTLKLSRDEVRSATDTVRLIGEDLSKILTEKDRLSLLYGVLNRKDLRFRFVHWGSSVLFHAPAGGAFKACVAEQAALTADLRGLEGVAESEIELNANDRLVLLSDGFIERAGGVEEARKLLEGLRDRDAEDSLNELTFQVKRRFEERDDVPEQDCSAIVMDVDSRALKLA